MSNHGCSILSEFNCINFKDKRLNIRFGEIMQVLCSKPSGLIAKAFIDAKDQKAAYRFFDNPKTTYETMLTAHQQCVSDRCKSHDIILAIQDTTSIFLPGARKVSDIGNIGDLARQHPGLNIHSTLLVTPKHEILGISDLQIFDRKKVTQSKTHDKLNALQKETGKGVVA
jgi:hypothetical protein